MPGWSFWSPCRGALRRAICPRLVEPAMALDVSTFLDIVIWKRSHLRAGGADMRRPTLRARLLGLALIIAVLPGVPARAPPAGWHTHGSPTPGPHRPQHANA